MEQADGSGALVHFGSLTGAARSFRACLLFLCPFELRGHVPGLPRFDRRSKLFRVTTQHSSLSKLAELILDYLRTVIVVALVIGQSKSGYIPLIDDVLVSEGKRNELIELRIRAKALL